MKKFLCLCGLCMTMLMATASEVKFAEYDNDVGIVQQDYNRFLRQRNQHWESRDRPLVRVSTRQSLGLGACRIASDYWGNSM